MIIVSDNSALSCLAELGELELLNRLYGTVTITATVRKEGRHSGAPEALRRLLEDPPAWLVVVPDAVPYLEDTRDLDAGEASAITLAWKHRENSLLIIDEKRGRRTSAALGIRITGAAGMLTDAAGLGWIDFDEVFLRLSRTRFRLSDSVIDDLRKRYRSQQS